MIESAPHCTASSQVRRAVCSAGAWSPPARCRGASPAVSAGSSRTLGVAADGLRQPLRRIAARARVAHRTPRSRVHTWHGAAWLKAVSFKMARARISARLLLQTFALPSAPPPLTSCARGCALPSSWVQPQWGRHLSLVLRTSISEETYDFSFWDFEACLDSAILLGFQAKS